MQSRGFRFLASPRLTCVLLVACMVVVFFGTIEQPVNGLRPVQRHYFEAWLALWPMAPQARPGGWLCLPLPGGFALGVALLANLVAAALRFFRPSWRLAGVALIHLGLVVLFAGGFVIAALQKEFVMAIPQGESCDFVMPAHEPAAAASSTAATASGTASAPVAPPNRVELPFALHLDKFTHEVYPGSSIPKNYASSLRILPKGGSGSEQGRAVEIRMNAPLRHGGYSFFQGSFRYASDGTPTTILQVVRNPGWALPYVAFYMMGAGMLLQFLTSLALFLAKRAKAGASAAAVLFAVLAMTATAPSASAESEAGKPNAGEGLRSVAEKLGMLPVQYNGRLQPIDSFARNTLLLLRGRQNVAFSKEAAVMFGTRPSQWTLPAEQLARETGIVLTAEEIAMLERQPVPLEIGLFGRGTLDANTWLLEVAFRPALAARFPIVRVENAEVRALLGPKPGAIAHYSWNEIVAAWEKVNEAVKPLQQKKPKDYTAFEHGLAKLSSAVDAYAAAAVAFAPGDLPNGRLPREDYAEWESLNRDALAWRKAMSAPEPTSAAPPLLARPKPQFGEVEMRRLGDFLKRYGELAEKGAVGIVPPAAYEHHRDTSATPVSPVPAPAAAVRWDNLGQALLHRHPGASADFKPTNIVQFYGDLATAWNAGDADAGGKIVSILGSTYQDAGVTHDRRRTAEVFFNHLEPFFKSLVLYVAIFLLVCLAWATGKRRLLGAAFWGAVAVLVLHTAAIGARMWIQDRPPVTNLYSTAIVVSWGAVVLGLVIERFLKNGIGTAVAAITGFASLIVAHNLAMNGDTMGMMQAVLDDNFWLATHVVTITLGYSGMFAAGLLGALWVFRRVFGREAGTPPAAAGGDPLERIVHGVVCFALLLSFAGTMLGGLWADKSWGRFWGWDPKENGALLVVLWCAVFLHARAFRLLRPRGLMQLAVAGNIVTAASWFGTNLLGTGLHSYGFSQGGAFWLYIFWLSQLAIILLAFLPPLRRATTAAGAK